MATKLMQYDSSDVQESVDGPEYLAQAEGLGSVTLCDCGTLSLNVQAISLRMDLKAFAQMAILCRDAMTALERMAHEDEMQKLVSPSPLMH